MPIVDGISVNKSKLRLGRFHSKFKNRWEMWNGSILGWLPLGDEAFPLHRPLKRGEASGQYLTHGCAGVVRTKSNYENSVLFKLAIKTKARQCNLIGLC